MFANTQKQPLTKHLFAVGYVAYKLLKQLNIDQSLANLAFLAGVLHDIGKADPNFQNWLKRADDVESDNGVHIDTAKFSFEKYPRHNEISWLLAKLLLTATSHLNRHQIEHIGHAVYFHHLPPFRLNTEPFSTAQGLQSFIGDIDGLYRQVVSLLHDVRQLAQAHDPNLLNMAFSSGYQLTDSPIPAYKHYSVAKALDNYQAQASLNAQASLVRMAVIVADRLVSSLPAQTLAEHIQDCTLDQLIPPARDTGLQEGVQACLDGFWHKYPNSHRNEQQASVARQLAKVSCRARLTGTDGICVLQGSAGCGKTKIALEWALNTEAKQLLWICPRVQVAQGIFHDLSQGDYLPTLPIEIYTGEFKQTAIHGIVSDTIIPFSGAVVITTIDQVVNSIVSHQRVNGLIDFMTAHVVIDEYHEIINTPAHNLLLAELVSAKREQNGNLLLVSATPNPLFIKQVLNISDRQVVTCPTFNQSDYFIDLQSVTGDDPMLNKAPTDQTTFFISNTAQTAQLGYLVNPNRTILYHAKYTKADKAQLFDRVFDCFKQGGNRQYQVLRGSQVLQCSLNITCERMFTEFTTPENWLQRLGRLDRFGENLEINHYTTYCYPKDSMQAWFLSSLDSYRTATAWIGYLNDYLPQDGVIKLDRLYGLYNEFYRDPKSIQFVTADLLANLEKSVNLIQDKLFTPMSMPNRKQAGRVIKLSQNSLRGDSVFVTLAVFDLDKQATTGYTEPLAYSTDRVVKSGLLQFFHKQDRKLNGNRLPKAELRLPLAKCQDNPIYLSYCQEELDSINQQAHEKELYYVMGDKQPIGILPKTFIFRN